MSNFEAPQTSQPGPPSVLDRGATQHSHTSYAPRPPQHAHYPPPGHPQPPPTHQGYHQAWHYPPPPPHAGHPPSRYSNDPTPARPPHHATHLQSDSDSNTGKDVSSTPTQSTSEVDPKSNASAPANTATNNHSRKSKSPNSPQKEIREQQLQPQQNDSDIEEPKVDPMKQDFHFYAMDNYQSVLDECKRKLIHSNLVYQTSPENEVYLSTTLLNAHLIHKWEIAPQSTRAHYLKLEENDRKRFMSEDEVASRHCATLTARKRSPKQGGGGGGGGAVSIDRVTTEGLGAARSFGLGEVVPQMVGVLNGGGGGELDGGKRRKFA
eukprot:CCRYP_004398-RA/>CCRYP_004398-RA protein AED:0.26 eAED:0.04 QI:0/-1/0/1/-1/1/1/0/321